MRPDRARKHDFPNHQQVVERQRERVALQEDGIPRNISFSLDDLSDAVADVGDGSEETEPPDA